MKILFSDYDGTLKNYIKNPNILEKYIFNLNLKAIDKFMENGNKFIITTGRNTESILDSCQRNKVNYHYITAYDGKVTLSNEGKVIYAKYINKKILDLIDFYNIGDIIGSYGVIGNTKNENEIIYLVIKTYGDVTYKINQLRLMFKDFDFNYYKLLNRLTIYYLFDKKMGIDELVRLLNLKGEIYTVGDGANDKTMLEAYNGYKMLISYPSLFKVNCKITTSIHSLIKKIN